MNPDGQEVLVYRALLLTGVSGVGKSTVLGAIGQVFAGEDRVTAVVDTDALAQFGPQPRGEGIHDRMKCANLAAVWSNYRSAGARFIVVAAGIESKELRDRYSDSLADCEIQLVRLVAPTATVRTRLQGRDEGAVLDRHLTSLVDQEAVLDAAALEDFAVLNDRPPAEVAREIITRARWI